MAWIDTVWQGLAESGIDRHSIAHFGIVWHSFSLPIHDRLFQFPKKITNFFFFLDFTLRLTMPHYNAL